MQTATTVSSKFCRASEQSPEYIHTYKTTPLSLWNSAGFKLFIGINYRRYRKIFKIYNCPANVIDDMHTLMTTIV